MRASKGPTTAKPAAKPAGKARHRRSGPTIRDVAREAEVSIGTVSKALNGQGNLRTETRTRVAEAAKRLGFRPNDLAQALHRGQSFTVGLISNDSFGRFTMPIVEGLEACLAAQKIAVFMCNATDDPERERQHVEQLMGKRVDGLVITARRSDYRPSIDLGQIALPVVYVFAGSRDPDALVLLPDDRGGARTATEHLIALGRTRIAHVTGPEHFEAVQLRHQGYRDALDAAGLTEAPETYLTGKWSEAWGREAARKLFSAGGRPPDAVFCGNDQIARGICDTLHELGLDVPNQVAIVGFDNWDVMAEAARPPLTSVDMNLKALGWEAGRQLTEMIQGKVRKGIILLPCTLVVRQSSGPPAA